MFRALVLRRDGKEPPVASVDELSEKDLPEGDVLVRVDYSTLNYKDGLCLQGQGGLVRTYPHVGGIDFSGCVEESAHKDFKAGDRVVLTGWRVGEVHWGGYAQKARVNGDWLVALPDSISTRAAMLVGTAGFTAALALGALEDHGVTPASGPVLVTGAAGGVGSVALILLARCGYRAVALTGRAHESDYLKGLGAQEIMPRDDLLKTPHRPLESETWAGAIDTVAGKVLEGVLPRMAYGASVCAVGLAAGAKIETTVIPFLLRGVNLLGIDSVMCPREKRSEVWSRIEKDLSFDRLEAAASQIGLEQVPAYAKEITAGRVRGRVLVDVNA